MLEGKLIYYAIFVFALLIVGLVLTILEYKKLDEQGKNSEKTPEVPLPDGKLKAIKY